MNQQLDLNSTGCLDEDLPHEFIYFNGQYICKWCKVTRSNPDYE